MTTPEVSVIRTGVANLASVVAGFERLGAHVHVKESADDAHRASFLVLPGVGAFGAGMKQLHDTGVVEALQERVALGRPTLAVCLGLQLLCDSSEESPDVRGLGVLPDRIKRFPPGLSVPQMGWNQIAPDDRCRLLQPGYAYFANSYRLLEAPAGWQVATADYGGKFVAALERGAVLACQFHPELSSAWGQSLLARWLQMPSGGGTDVGA